VLISRITLLNPAENFKRFQITKCVFNMLQTIFKTLQSTKKCHGLLKTVQNGSLRALSTNDRPAPEHNVGNSPVWSCNGWDPLEEVIVGVSDYAVVPKAEPTVLTCFKTEDFKFFEEHGGKYWADVLGSEMWTDLLAEVEELAHVLKEEGVIVKRPDRVDWGQTISTPTYTGPGMYASMPRDSLLIVGDEIIEAPLAWRMRYFEYTAFRNLVQDYYQKGARWTAAPKSFSRDSLVEKNADGSTYLLTEDEPVFDAADFMRLGRDIVGLRSQVTNLAGIDWLRRHLAPRGIKVHTLFSDNPFSMHIDVTFLPLRPGLAVIHPKYRSYGPAIDHLEAAGWKIIPAPFPTAPKKFKNGLSSNFISINFLQIAPDRIICEADEPDLQDFLRKQGITPIPIKFRTANILGGGFHCHTSDIRRKGAMESYT